MLTGIGAKVFSAPNISYIPPIILPVYPGLPAASLTNNGRIYCTYMGRWEPGTPVKFVNRIITANAVGVLTRDEVGVYSSEDAPNFSTQDLTRIVWTGAVDDLFAGVFPRRIKNTNDFNILLDDWTYLWAVSTTAIPPGTQPTFRQQTDANAHQSSYQMRSALDTLGSLGGLSTITAAQLSLITSTCHPVMSISTV